MNSDFITHQIENVNFDVYSAEDIRKASAKQITNPIAFDNLGRPTLGGLYDQALGISPYDKTSICPTCNLDSTDCPGHFGHIELPACVYNPFAIGYLSKLLNGKCFNCHKLRMREKDKKYFYVKLLLIKLGLISEGKQFESIYYNTLSKESDSSLNQNINIKINKLIRSLKQDSSYEEDIDHFGDSNLNQRNNDYEQSLNTMSLMSNLSDNTQANTVDDNVNEKQSGTNKKAKETDPLKKHYQQLEINMKNSIAKCKEEELDKILIKISERIKEFKKNSSLNDQNTDIQLELKKTLKEFWNGMKLSKCPNCQAFPVKIKKQGYLKFFKLPIAKNKSKQNKTLGLDTNKDSLMNKRKTNGMEIDDDIKIEGEDDNSENNENVNESDSDDEIDHYVSDKLRKLNEAKKNKKRNLNEDTIVNNTDINKNKSKKKKKNGDLTEAIEEELHDSVEAKYLHPEEVKEQMKRLWNRESEILSLVFGNVFKKGKRNNIFSVESSGTDIFFIETLLVPPVRFRPENKSGGEDSVYLHHQSVMLTKILNISADLKLYSDIIIKNKQNGGEVNNEENDKSDDKKQAFNASYKDIVAKWIELQDNVNLLYDGMKASKLQDKDIIGIRQILEKKEGIFRMKMMGKRVNYAGRSVISPDPMINTGEVGVPLYIAGKLTIPESVTDFNRDRLKQLILNGAFKYPGANMIETVQGRKILLDSVKDDIRINKLAKSLDPTPKDAPVDPLLEKFRVKTVYRHLQSGDALLVNRQPTLHKPSIMSHRAKVLKGEKTIRLHYSNCSSYNADFDGDEMNIHLLQNQIAREEAYSISNTENQYIVPTSGNPIRGLIQDSIISSVILSLKSTFLNKSDFFQLIYAALENPLNSGKIKQILIPEPAIIKPQMLWSGKQVISCVLKSLVSNHDIFGNDKQNNSLFSKNKNTATPPLLNMEQKSKLNSNIFTQSHEQETVVIIRGNELMTGIIDKNQIGNSTFGLVHSYYELYGPHYAGELLSTFGRLFINYIQFFHGFTCGVADLQLTEDTNLKRRRDIENILKSGMNSLADMFEIKDFNLKFDNFSNRAIFHSEEWYEKQENYLLSLTPEEQEEAKKLIRLQQFKVNKNLFKDNESQLQETSQKIKELKQIKPDNKSDKVEIEEKLEILRLRYSDLEVRINNENLIEKLRTKLQEKLLYDDSVEGNIDNTVKKGVNSASKCANSWLSTGLIKKFPKNYFSLMVLTGAKGSPFNHMQISCNLGQQELEGRRVPRMACGKTLPSFDYFDPNPRAGGFISDRFGHGIRPQEFFFHCMAGREGLIDTAVKTSRSGYLQRCLIKHLEQLVVHYDNTVRDTDGKIIQFLYGEDGVDPICSKFMNNFDFMKKNLDSYMLKYPVSQLKKYNVDTDSVKHFLKNNYLSIEETVLSKFSPSRYIGSKSDLVFQDSAKFLNNFKDNESDEKKKFRQIVDMKYFKSLIQPGENVGIIAAQSIGEPSTQMTLNTFHLAGHGGANMTLGIPRMREILMTSEKNIKTPIMILPTYFDRREDAELIAREFEKYFLIDIMKEIVISTDILPNKSEKSFERVYHIEMQCEDINDITNYFKYTSKEVKKILKRKFIPVLAKLLNKQYKQTKKSNDDGVKINKQKFFDEENEQLKNKNDDDEASEDNNNKNTKQKRKSSEDSENSDEGSVDSHHREKKNIKNKTKYDTIKEEEDEDVSDREDDNEEEFNRVNATKNNAVNTMDVSINNEIEEDAKITSFNCDFIQINNIVFNKKSGKFSYNIVIPYTQKPILVKK